jgi:hypothetical protein
MLPSCGKKLAKICYYFSEHAKKKRKMDMKERGSFESRQYSVGASAEWAESQRSMLNLMDDPSCLPNVHFNGANLS